MGRVARYKRIKSFDPGAKKRPAPPEKGAPKNMAPKNDPDVIPQRLAEMLKFQVAAKTANSSIRRDASLVPPSRQREGGTLESPQEFYKVRLRK